MSQNGQGYVSELAQARAERDEYKGLYIGIAKRLDETRTHLEEVLLINEAYRRWFTYHAKWVFHHNRMLQWSPKKGYPQVPGGHPNAPFKYPINKPDPLDLIDDSPIEPLDSGLEIDPNLDTLLETPLSTGQDDNS